MNKISPSRGKVLLVDDDASLLSKYLGALQELNYEVITADSFPSAVIALKGHNFAAVLTDLNMDTWDAGFLLAKYVTENYKGTSVVIHTADGNRAYVHTNYSTRAKECGAVGIFAKDEHTAIDKLGEVVKGYSDKHIRKKNSSTGELEI